MKRASLGCIGEYLKLFPRKRFVLIDKFEGEWFGVASSSTGTRFVLAGPVPIRLVGGATLASFDTVCTRFDGDSF